MALSPKESGKIIASLTNNIAIKDDGIKKLGDVVSSKSNKKVIFCKTKTT